MVAINFKTFSDVLAKRQGGFNLKPGHSITKELSGQDVKAIFGVIPSAVSAYGITITVKPTTNGRYKLTVRMEK